MNNYELEAKKLISMFDSNALPKIIGTEDRNILVDLYQIYLKQSEDHRRVLDSAVLRSDCDLVEHIAHSMASNSYILGDIKLTNLLRELEIAAEKGDVNVMASLAEILSPLLVRSSLELRRHITLRLGT